MCENYCACNIILIWVFLYFVVSFTNIEDDLQVLYMFIIIFKN